ncbi:hypothetical protein M513_12536 [Trichuris suis]|uniref:Uncharacterized protein n=1 Tax=Trichuris suis TaxID=68888 RepID=A0A085LNQ6_9BILA|nr:hypothetical protein M513_12536 [Trichuris suis]
MGVPFFAKTEFPFNAVLFGNATKWNHPDIRSLYFTLVEIILFTECLRNINQFSVLADAANNFSFQSPSTHFDAFIPVFTGSYGFVGVKSFTIYQTSNRFSCDKFSCSKAFYCTLVHEVVFNKGVSSLNNGTVIGYASSDFQSNA